LSIVANHAAAALENVRLIRDIERSHLSTIESMALLLEARDPYTRFHSQRVRDVSVAIAQRMGLSRENIDVLRIGATLHDIGKVGVPDGVLNKPGRLDEAEWEMIRRHPRIGFEVLEPVHFLKTGLLDIVHYHHERVDGTGYPRKLKESQISPLVRIIGVADSYDAMASSRAYRKAMQRDDIIAEFIRCSGTQFDPDITTVFIEMIRADELPPATC
jgi:HD-GYP domain-containing protein (c-di-GMP phosphodiesterase class II)